jgi:predicted transcriptional regulator
MSVYAKDIMTPHVKSVPENWTVKKFAAFLSENQITGSPVVDKNGEIVGIATLFDIADFHLNQPDTSRAQLHLTPEEELEATHLRHLLVAEMANTPVEVRDIMTPQLFWVDELTPIKSVAELMINERIHRVFVKKDGAIAGIVTTFDMLRMVADMQE